MLYIQRSSSLTGRKEGGKEERKEEKKEERKKGRNLILYWPENSLRNGRANKSVSVLGNLESNHVWLEKLYVVVSCRKATDLLGVTWWLVVRCLIKLGEKIGAGSHISTPIGGQFCSETED